MWIYSGSYRVKPKNVKMNSVGKNRAYSGETLKLPGLVIECVPSQVGADPDHSPFD